MPAVEHDGEATDLVDTLQSARRAWLIDAAQSNSPPGTIHRIDCTKDIPLLRSTISSHGFGLAEAIGLARALGIMPPHCIIYAIEAVCFTLGKPHSPPVAKAAREVAHHIWLKLRSTYHHAQSAAYCCHPICCVCCARSNGRAGPRRIFLHVAKNRLVARRAQTSPIDGSRRQGDKSSVDQRTHDAVQATISRSGKCQKNQPRYGVLHGALFVADGSGAPATTISKSHLANPPAHIPLVPKKSIEQQDVQALSEPASS